VSNGRDCWDCAAECSVFLVHLSLLACSLLHVSLCSLPPSVLPHGLAEAASYQALTKQNSCASFVVLSCIVACHVEEDLAVMEYIQKGLIAQVVA